MRVDKRQQRFSKIVMKNAKLFDASGKILRCVFVIERCGDNDERLNVALFNHRIEHIFDKAVTNSKKLAGFTRHSILQKTSGTKLPMK